MDGTKVRFEFIYRAELQNILLAFIFLKQFNVLNYSQQEIYIIDINGINVLSQPAPT